MNPQFPTLEIWWHLRSLQFTVFGMTRTIYLWNPPQTVWMSAWTCCTAGCTQFILLLWRFYFYEFILRTEPPMIFLLFIFASTSTTLWSCHPKIPDCPIVQFVNTYNSDQQLLTTRPRDRLWSEWVIRSRVIGWWLYTNTLTGEEFLSWLTSTSICANTEEARHFANQLLLVNFLIRSNAPSLKHSLS